MTKFRPIPKWKSIVGIAASSVITCFGIAFCIAAQSIEGGDVQAVIFVIGVTLIAIGLIFLFVNLSLFRLSNMERNKLANNSRNVDQKEKIETLHKLLAEGKISIEEYDKLSK